MLKNHVQLLVLVYLSTFTIHFEGDFREGISCGLGSKAYLQRHRSNDLANALAGWVGVLNGEKTRVPFIKVRIQVLPSDPFGDFK